MVILLGSQKGGCGKSTLAVNMAAYLALHKKDVVLLDADIQQSAANWVRDRDETSLVRVHCVQRYGDVKNTLKDLNQRYDYVIVDVAGHDSKELRTALLVADVLIVPFRPSQFDLDTLPHLTQVVDLAKSFNENLKSYALLTLAPTHATTAEIQQAWEYLKDFPDFKALTSVIYDRKVYRDSIGEGKAVVESNNAKAVAEFEQLMQELLND